jgi:hypothetical protein
MSNNNLSNQIEIVDTESNDFDESRLFNFIHKSYFNSFEFRLNQFIIIYICFIYKNS